MASQEYGRTEWFGARFQRAIAVFLCASLFVTQCGLGMDYAVRGIGDALQRAFAQLPGPYTERPRPLFFGANHRRDPRTRGGMWTAGAIQDAAASRTKTLWASIEGAAPPPQHSLSCDVDPGPGLTWEGVYPVPFGSVNTGNGNKLTEIPLVSFRDRGGMTVDFTLYHNSETTYNDELGKSWTWTYDIYINEGQSSAIVHWGDGSAIPYTPPGGGGGGEELAGDADFAAFVASIDGSGKLPDTTYTSPAGIYDTLVKHQDGTWTLTAKDQTDYNFNDDGFCDEIVDRNGNTITLTLNAQNYVTLITAPSGRTIDISLDGNNNFTGITDGLGREWSFNINGGTDRLDSIEYPVIDSTTYTDEFTYDSSSRITTLTDRRDKDWTFSYNSDSSLASFTTPLSHTTSLTYASGATTITLPGTQTIVHHYTSGKLSDVTDQGSFAESYTYNASNQVTSLLDRRSKTWSYTYDARGNVLTVTNPLSKVWTYTYSSENDLLTEEDHLGNTTTYDYDANGNLETVTNPNSDVVETNTYDAYGQIETSTNGESEETDYAFDTYGNLVSITDPLTNETTATYDDLNRITGITDPNGNTEAISYDAWERPATITHEDTSTILYEYDAVDHVTSVTNELGNATSYTYDNSERLTQVTNANSETEVYAYNSNGWRTSVTNGRNKTRNYTYTSRGEVYTLTLADSSVETWSYNGNGQVSAYQNPLSQTISYTYDNASRMTGVDYPSGTDTSFAYDDANRRTSMTDATGTTYWSYDDASQLTQFDPPSGLIDYAYDLAGRRATMDEDSVGTTTYTYDSAGRLTSLENPFSEVTEFDYDAGGRETQRTFDTGAYTVTAYDTQNRPTSITLKNSSYATISSESYTYDDGGNLSDKTVNSVTTTYGYDDIDQLTSESRSGYSASYTYDANGNRATKTLNSVTQTYNNDDADKLTSITQGGNTVKSFGYDTAGRTTSVTANSQTTTIAYDYEGRITQITYPNESTNTFTYNGLDTRVGKVDSTGTKTFLRDGADVTDPVINDGASYTPGISERRSSTTKFYHADRLGSTERLTNTSQSTTDTREYDAFGLLTSSSGSTPTPFGFAGDWGYQEDTDSGLKLLGHRYYDPSTGRFLTRDPIGDGRNWYAYCENDPLAFVDPDGLQLGLGAKIVREWIKRLFPKIRKSPTTGKSGTIPKRVIPSKTKLPTPGKARLVPDKQGKHIPGHKNFIPGRSELTHPDPKGLIEKFGGRGKQVGKTPRGKPGYKEEVDFGEPIGTWVDKNGNRFPTTKGIIHHDGSGGAHIVPSG